MTVVDVFEIPTDETLDAERYQIANPDVRAAGVDPLLHFRRFGQSEGRQQITASFSDTGARRAEFLRFRPALALEQDAETFPVVCGAKQLSLADYQAESANDSFGPFVDEVARHPERLYLDLGCGLRRKVYDNCLYLEVYPSLTADLIVEADKPYPIRSGTLDGIGCFAVLEHVRRPWLVVEEIGRMLKAGGRAWIDWPFLQPVHGFPSHYFNATREGLRTLFEDTGFSVQEIRTWPHQAPDYTLNWVFGKFVRDLPAAQRDKIMAMSVGELLSHRPGDAFWRELLSHLSDATILEFACGNTLIATKNAD
jgi:SAM-dependent methyltransferase